MGKPDLLNHQGNQYEKIHLIRNVDIHTGYGALMVYVLNGIRKALENNHLPVIYIDKETTAHFYDRERGENIWEYFFLPINSITYDQIEQSLAIGHISKEEIYTPSSEEVMHWHQSDENRLATFWAWEEPKDKQKWMQEKRALGRDLVAKYVKVRPEILDRVGELVRSLFTSSYIIGVHIRGTDFTYATATPITAYFDEIDRILIEEKRENVQIFVATDQQQYVDEFELKYPDKVICIDAIRSKNNIAPFRFQKANGYKKGEDVLMDILLLSRCDHIIKSASAVGEIALWFNPELTCTDFALRSNFIAVGYTSLNSAYSRLDIDKKGALRMKIMQFGEFCWKFLESNYRLRPLYKLILFLKRI